MIKFIKLNKICEKGTYQIYVNVEDITTFAKGYSDCGTWITLRGLSRVEVVESEEEILRKINKINKFTILEKEKLKLNASCFRGINFFGGVLND